MVGVGDDVAVGAGAATGVVEVARMGMTTAVLVATIGTAVVVGCETGVVDVEVGAGAGITVLVVGTGTAAAVLVATKTAASLVVDALLPEEPAASTVPVRCTTVLASQLLAAVVHPLRRLATSEA